MADNAVEKSGGSNTITIPAWLRRHAVSVGDKDNAPLSDVALLPSIQEYLNEHDIKSLFPVQAAVLPLLIKRIANNLPCDMLVAAPTGSGKTLAYLLPMTQALASLSHGAHVLRAIIVCPSRDLAIQVYDVANDIMARHGLRLGLLTGKKSFHDEVQMLHGAQPHTCIHTVSTPTVATLSTADKMEMFLAHGIDDVNDSRLERVPFASQLHSSVDVVICTPGRLVDHLHHNPFFNLDHLRYIVVDEADKLLSQQYHGWIQAVLSKTKPQLNTTSATDEVLHRKLLYTWVFSATLTRNPIKLCRLMLDDPVFVSVNSETAKTSAKHFLPTTLKERLIVCRKNEDKAIALHSLIKTVHKDVQIIVFVGTIQDTGAICRYLTCSGIEGVCEIHSNINQEERNSTLDKFRNRQLRVVVASDVLARGLDLPDVGVVISFDIPISTKIYVHRVGRTARAGHDGVAYTLALPKHVTPLRKMVEKIGNSDLVKVTVSDLTGHVPDLNTEHLVSLYKKSLTAKPVKTDRKRPPVEGDDAKKKHKA